MPDFYPEGNTVLASDDELRTLHKIAALAASGGGGGSGATLVGAGAPGAGLGSSGNTYWDSTNKDFYVKDGASWTLLTDIV
jgi:hypothetical protein